MRELSFFYLIARAWKWWFSWSLNISEAPFRIYKCVCCIYNICDFVPGIKLFSLRFVPTSLSLPCFVVLRLGLRRTHFCFATAPGSARAVKVGTCKTGGERSTLLPQCFLFYSPAAFLPVPPCLTQHHFSPWQGLDFAVATVGPR